MGARRWVTCRVGGLLHTREAKSIVPEIGQLILRGGESIVGGRRRAEAGPC